MDHDEESLDVSDLQVSHLSDLGDLGQFHVSGLCGAMMHGSLFSATHHILLIFHCVGTDDSCISRLYRATAPQGGQPMATLAAHPFERRLWLTLRAKMR